MPIYLVVFVLSILCSGCAVVTVADAAVDVAAGGVKAAVGSTENSK